MKTSAPLSPSPPSLQEQTVLITYTIHNRLTWGYNQLSRLSQHALLASQTLGDLFEAMPCVSNEIPQEVVERGKAVGFERRMDGDVGGIGGSRGCVVCIEGRAYGDGLSEFDYAE